MKSIQIVWIILMTTLLSCQQNLTTESPTETIELSGTWGFELDPDYKGLEEKWFARKLSDNIQLPGTTDENQKGIFLDESADDRLSRVWYWKGAAWYQKEVDIPEDWEGKNIQLMLERTKDTHVWLNDNYCGYENTLSAPQYFDLTHAVKPGKSKITILVDNAKLPPVGNSFAIDEKTQTNWNGIIGKLELHATDPVWIDDVQAYPNIENNSVRLRVTIINTTKTTAEGTLTVGAESWNTERPIKFRNQKETITGIQNQKVIEFSYNFNMEAPLWDEFDPALIKLSLNLLVETDDKNYNHTEKVNFGMRAFKRKENHLTINGERVFLRGRIDCANYPLTGYPPMKKSEWLTMFRQLRSYGINHWRFHSWCPPQAALMAADEEGIYLQLELPNQRYEMDSKNYEDDEMYKKYDFEYIDLDTNRINMSLKEYLQREGELILRHFGNNPSFTLFTLGNELGRNQAMYDLVAHFKKIDPARKLYAQGSNNMALDPSLADGDDFLVTARASREFGIRGSFALHLTPEVKPHIEYTPPSTYHTYTEAIEHLHAPIISHEVGQYQVSPDFSEIPKYTGVTRAKNYEIFRERLKEANMLDQSDDFVQASGKLAVICYKEDIEAALRTPDFTGFQLLDIMDFPGQGTAPVGIMNVFLESKGLIAPEEWKQFCNEVVPLLKMEKFTWTNTEQFAASVEVAHYGKEDFNDAVVSWMLVNEKGDVHNDGQFMLSTIPRGGLVEIGELSFPLNVADEAEKLEIVISIDDTPYRNTYDVWVYPEMIDTSIPEGILVSRSLNSDTRKHLEEGGKAIIFPDHDRLPHSIEGAFQTDFWCWRMFARGARNRGMEPAPGSLGFICDPDSPLLTHFPTDFHSNWQWWHLVKNCQPIILDDTPADYKPLIQTIDNFVRNQKLGMVFETKYGEGSALICAIDLPNLQEHPEGRQLYYSILNYVNSKEFSPQQELSKTFLSKIIL